MPCGRQSNGRPGLFYEIKFDGYRRRVERFKKPELYSRLNNSNTQKYPEIAAAFNSLPEETVLDGELVALDDEGTALLQSALEHRRAALQIANPHIEDRIVPAVTAGILIARITAAGCAGSAGVAWSSAVRLAIVEKSFAIFTSRNRGDDSARPRSNRVTAAMVSTHCT